MQHRQRGITFIGLLMILSLVGLIAYAGMRLAPVYLNYMKISRAMQQIAVEFKNEPPDPGRIRVALDRRWAIEDVALVDTKDIEVKKEGDIVVMHVAYDHTVPYISNVSLTASFDKSVKIE